MPVESDAEAGRAALPASPQMLQQHVLQRRPLHELNLRHGQYASLQLPGANLQGQDLHAVNFQDAGLEAAVLRDVQATRGVFTKARLLRADFRGAQLKDAQFISADLSQADLRGCTFSADTCLRGAKVCGMRLDGRGLRMLGADRGGLTDADLAELLVEDDQARLMLSFGGFWTCLHLAAVVIFLLPYCIYAIRRYVQAQITPCIEPEACIDLGSAIGRYIVRGGAEGDDTDLLALSIFGLLLVYNVFRISLVYKAQSLKLSESATGLPQQFVLRGYWSMAYYGCQLLLWLNLALVLVHAYGFLDTPVWP